VVVQPAVDRDSLPRVELGLPASAADPVEAGDEVLAEGEQELLGRADAVLLRERVDRVLLRVGGHDLAVVALDVARHEVAAQLRGDVEVLDLVPIGVAGDPHQPVLGLPVLVRSQHDVARRHGQLPR
jgi:hypothetical protein